MRILHVVHDFLPAVSAGVEVYTFNLAREQARRHETVVFHASFLAGAPDYDVRRGSHGGVRTIEVVNNRLYRAFHETWHNPGIETIFAEVLREFRPDAVHFHHLLNLSAGCVRVAHDAGARTVFTLHDFFAICPAGGQLFDAAGRICPGPGEARCPSCYASSGQHLGPAERIAVSARSRAVASVAKKLRRRFPAVVENAARLARRAAAALRPPASWNEISERNAAVLGTLSACDTVISPSRFLGRSLQAFGMKRDFVHSDYGFVRPGDSRPTTHDPRLANSCAGPNAARRAEATPSVVGRRSPVVSPLRVGFIGPITKHKGIEVLLKAAEIAGAGIEVNVHGGETVDPALVARLKQRFANDSRLTTHDTAPGCQSPVAGCRSSVVSRTSSVTFVGPFPPDALDDVFGGLDVLVVPSMWPENSPLVIHEAFLRGVPVVASHIGGIPELVKDGASGFLFPPGDAEKLAHLLRRISANRGILDGFRKRLPRVKTIAGNAGELDGFYAR